MSRDERFPAVRYVRPEEPQVGLRIRAVDRSVCWSLAYSRIIKLLPGRRLEFLSLTVCFTGSSGSVLVRVPHRWRSHVAAHIDLVASYC